MKLFTTTIFLLAALLLHSHVSIAQLQANFTADKNGGCSPVAVTFTNTTTGASANAVYTWDLGNGNTSASFNAGALYKEEKNYTVTLTVQDGGKSSVKTQTITVYAKPVVNDFTFSPVKECIPVNATFNATTTPGSGYISSYFWDFGDGNTQQGYGPSQQHTYTVPGKATVSLTVANNFGCTNTLVKKDIIEVLPAINASFSASQTILCRETDAVQFTNTSYGPGTLSYLWDFGDGTTSTVNAPSHSFNKKGIYTVKLTVTSSEGCVISSTQVGYINVNSFTSDFSVPPLICKDSYQTFNSTSTPYPVSSNWEVDGQPYYYYSSYLYLTFNTAGDHTIKLKNVFGTCPDSVIKTISIKEIPYPKGFLDTLSNNCGAPSTVKFKDTTAGAVKWEWNFNSDYYYNRVDAVVQAPVYTYSNNGGYNATLKVTNAAGCSATTSKFIGIGGLSIGITTTGNPRSCDSVKLSFAVNTNEEITNYNWFFSDGSTSTASNPEHVFKTVGNYFVTLTYTTKLGCTGTVSTSDIYVYGRPVADFTASSTTLCGTTPVTFAVKGQSNATYFDWYFGDSQFPSNNYNNTSITHQYNYDSTYSVKLIVGNDGHCWDTITKTAYIKVLPPFPIIANVVNTCDGTRGLVTFTQASKKGETFTWNFGDGNTMFLNTDQATVSHTYTKTGDYPISLTVTNGQCSLTATTNAAVLIKQNPVLTVSPSEVCAGQPFSFLLNNLDDFPLSGNYYGYTAGKWEYSNGATGFIGYSIANSNYYPYGYWITNASGTVSPDAGVDNKIRFIFSSSPFLCADTSNFVIIKSKSASAGFQIIADKQCWKQAVILKDTSKANGSSKIIRWDWSFGDGASQSFTTGGNTISHQYSNPGSYYVTLNVTDASGCSAATASKYAEVYGPKAAFYPSSNPITITLPVYFYNNTNNYNSYNTQYKWDFGDGNTSTDYSPSYTYNIPGQYTVKLIALNPLTGCSDTVSQVITVLNFKPAFAFTNTIISGKCPPVLVRFTNNSINYTSVKWDFGDGVTADNLNYPSHIYEKPGKYIITLYVYGVSGLKATYTDSVFVQQPSATLKTDTTEICKDGQVNFSTITANTNKQLWDFGDGNLFSSADKTSSHSYNTPGIYKPSVMVTDTNGCAVLTPLNATINVHANPVINFSPAQPLVCKGKTVQINASGGTSYEWTPATGLSNPAIASPYASPSVNTTYQVTAKDNIGCSSTSAVDVIVGQPFTMHISPDTSVCLGQSVLLLASGANTYQWINNTIGLSNTQSATPVASPLLASSYTVTGTDQYKCFTDTAHVAVKVLPLPSVSAGPDVEVLGGTPVQLSSATDNDVIQWTWSPSTYLNCTSCPSPVSTPMAQTAYTVTVKNKNGCTASDTMIVKLQCDQERVRIPNAFTPNRDNSNDVFMIKGISLIKHLVIFGRWGEKVFERSNFIASDRSSCWDGNYKGNPADAGTYVYFVEMQCATGGVFTFKGSVILIR